MPRITLEGVSHAYGPKAVLHDVSFTVAEGRIAGLLGVNGAGKTTLTRLISTVLPIQQGRCTVAGHDCRTEALAVRRYVAIVPQGSTLNLELNVAQNILTYLVLRGLTLKEARRRMHLMAERFGLKEYLKRSCMELSGGFRRRVQVARALAADAPCLILDEPSAGLDPLARIDLWRLIRESAGHRTVLLTTQVLDEAEACDTVLFLRGGRIAAEGPPDRVRAEHGTMLDAFVRLAGGEGP
ncbi:MAG: ABC transporter ATP-binding protein [Symbiobacteriia bacterium]